MIRTASHDIPLVNKFFNEAFLNVMSHFCNIDAISPCDNDLGKCKVTEEEASSISNIFIDTTLYETFDAFSEVGGRPFIKKKVAQLVKIAKSKENITLDLVSELLLYYIGVNCYMLKWKDEDGCYESADSRYEFKERRELLKAVLVDEDDKYAVEYNKKRKKAFRSFYHLMAADREEYVQIFWDIHFSFLMEDSVPEGILKLYTVTGDYDREWHIRPWVDIGEDVPEIVLDVLDFVEMNASVYGGLTPMRDANYKAFMDHILEPIRKMDSNKIEPDTEVSKHLQSIIDELMEPFE